MTTLIWVPAGSGTNPTGPIIELDLPAADFQIDPLAIAGASEFERSLLEDGQITYAEYERATLEMVDCLRGQGVDVDGPRPASLDGFLTYGFYEEDARGAFTACESEYGSVVFAVYFAQQIPTGADLQQEKLALIDCANDAGLPIAKGESVDMLRHIFVISGELTSAQLDCFAKHETVLHAIEEKVGGQTIASR
jgi:hypothetical protein